MEVNLHGSLCCFPMHTHEPGADVFLRLIAFPTQVARFVYSPTCLPHQMGIPLVCCTVAPSYGILQCVCAFKNCLCAATGCGVGLEDSSGTCLPPCGQEMEDCCEEGGVTSCDLETLVCVESSGTQNECVACGALGQPPCGALYSECPLDCQMKLRVSCCIYALRP